MAGSGPTIQIPRWIQLVVLPVAARSSRSCSRDARPRPLPLPDRERDRVHAQSARPRPHATQGAARAVASSIVFAIFLAVVVGAPRRARQRSSSIRRATPRIGSTSTSPRSVDRQPDRRRAGHRPAAGAGSTTTASSRSRCASRSNDWLDDAERGRGLRLRAGRDLVRAGGGVLGRRRCSSRSILIVVISIYMLLDMQRLERIDRRALPAARRRAADPADRERARGATSRGRRSSPPSSGRAPASGCGSSA